MEAMIGQYTAYQAALCPYDLKAQVVLFCNKNRTLLHDYLSTGRMVEHFTWTL